MKNRILDRQPSSFDTNLTFLRDIAFVRRHHQSISQILPSSYNDDIIANYVDAVCEARERKTKEGKTEGKKEERGENGVNGVKEDNGKDEDDVETAKSTVCYYYL